MTHSSGRDTYFIPTFPMRKDWCSGSLVQCPMTESGFEPRHPFIWDFNHSVTRLPSDPCMLGQSWIIFKRWESQRQWCQWPPLKYWHIILPLWASVSLYGKWGYRPHSFCMLLICRLLEGLEGIKFCRYISIKWKGFSLDFLMHNFTNYYICIQLCWWIAPYNGQDKFHGTWSVIKTCRLLKHIIFSWG